MWRWLFGPKAPVDPAAADRAVERAERDLQRVRAQRPTIRSLADDLRAAREQNNFAERIRAAYGEGQ